MVHLTSGSSIIAIWEFESGIWLWLLNPGPEEILVALCTKHCVIVTDIKGSPFAAYYWALQSKVS